MKYVKPDQLENYANMVDDNNYSEMLVQVATDFKLFQYAAAFNSILTLHNLEGEMKQDLLSLRTRYRDEMVKFLSYTLPIDDLNALKMYV